MPAAGVRNTPPSAVAWASAATGSGATGARVPDIFAASSAARRADIDRLGWREHALRRDLDLRRGLRLDHAAVVHRRLFRLLVHDDDADPTVDRVVRIGWIEQNRRG